MPKKSKKPITELSDDDAIKRLFPAKAVKQMKKIARESAEKKTKTKKKTN